MTAVYLRDAPDKIRYPIQITVAHVFFSIFRNAMSSAQLGPADLERIGRNEFECDDEGIWRAYPLHGTKPFA